MAARAIFTVLAGVCSVVAWGAEAGGPTPRDLWERVLPTLPPLEFAVEKDEMVDSDTHPGRRLRRVQVKFWYTYCDDIPYWRDLVWYPAYPAAAGDGAYESLLDGKTPDAWFVEVKDTAQGLPGYISSLPQDITHLPTKERISHGWRSRQWEPATAPKGR